MFIDITPKYKDNSSDINYDHLVIAALYAWFFAVLGTPIYAYIASFFTAEEYHILPKWMIHSLSDFFYNYFRLTVGSFLLGGIFTFPLCIGGTILSIFMIDYIKKFPMAAIIVMGTLIFLLSYFLFSLTMPTGDINFTFTIMYTLGGFVYASLFVNRLVR